MESSEPPMLLPGFKSVYNSRYFVEQVINRLVGWPSFAENISQDDIKTDHNTFVADVMFAFVDGRYCSDLYNLPAAKATVKSNL
jgi:hypothetical protein